MNGWSQTLSYWGGARARILRWRFRSRWALTIWPFVKKLNLLECYKSIKSISLQKHQQDQGRKLNLYLSAQIWFFNWFRLYNRAFVPYKDTIVKTPYMRSYSPPISVMVWEKANKRKNKMFGGGGESAVRERGVPANQTSLSSHVTSLGTTARTTSSKHPQLQNRGAKFKGRIKMNMRQLENTHPLDGQILPSTQG